MDARQIRIGRTGRENERRRKRLGRRRMPNGTKAEMKGAVRKGEREKGRIEEKSEAELSVAGVEDGASYMYIIYGYDVMTREPYSVGAWRKRRIERGAKEEKIGESAVGVEAQAYIRRRKLAWRGEKRREENG